MFFFFYENHMYKLITDLIVYLIYNIVELQILLKLSHFKHCNNLLTQAHVYCSFYSFFFFFFLHYNKHFLIFVVPFNDHST